VKLPAKLFERERVRGWLHEPAASSGDALAITHGAGADSDTTLLRAVAEAFCAGGWWVLRFDLPFRQERRHGPPFPAGAARDREGARRAVEALREIAGGRVFLGGHSYGGRQSTMLAAESPDLVDGLLLLSYPLHPPRKPQQLRTAHFDQLRTPALFAHGTRDPFGSIEEMRDALGLVPARTELMVVEGGSHGLSPAVAAPLPPAFSKFIGIETKR
jgi:predicted alpha/beta-hydrolase family hydrolase